MKLPQEIATEYTRLTGQDPTGHAVRALADVDGNLGEAYVICGEQALHILSRRIGENLIPSFYPYSIISSVVTEDDRPFSYLIITTPDESIRLKFGGLGQEALQTVIDTWSAKQPAAAAPAPTDPTVPPPIPVAQVVQPADDDEDQEPTPYVMFAAALRSLMEADGAVDVEENHFFQRLIGDSSVVARALDLMRTHDEEALPKLMADVLDEQQKLCLIANLIEIAMIDGYLRGKEQAMLNTYAEALGISQDAYDTLYDVLSMKNNLSIFTI